MSGRRASNRSVEPSLPIACKAIAFKQLLFQINYFLMSGRRASNSLPIAWKAIALPNELLPLMFILPELATSSLEGYRNGILPVMELSTK
jgi:hypothetical protein